MASALELNEWHIQLVRPPLDEEDTECYLRQVNLFLENLGAHGEKMGIHPPSRFEVDVVWNSTINVRGVEISAIKVYSSINSTSLPIPRNYY